MMWLIIVIVLALLIPEILSTVLDSRLGRAAASRLESGGAGSTDDVTSERIRYLEAEVDRLSDQVRRLSDESEFLHDLLADRRSRAEPRLPPGDREA